MAWVRRRRGKQEVTWRIGGVQHSERVADPRFLAAILREKRALEDAARGMEQADDGMHLLDRFLAAKRLLRRSESTITCYRQHIGDFIRANPIEPGKWTRAMVEMHLAARAHWKPAGLAMIRASLRVFWRWARERRVYVADLTTGLQLPAVKPKPRRALRAEEIDRLVAAARGRRYAPAVALAAWAGLSLGDILALRWSEVDLDRGVIERPGGRQKTGETLRVPIIPELAEVLTSVKPLDPVGLVCKVGHGPRSANRALRRLFTKAGLDVPKGEGYHLLRHSFTTMLKRAGVPMADAGALISHRRGSSMTGIYTHTDDADRVAAMRALQRHIEGERGRPLAEKAPRV